MAHLDDLSEIKLVATDCDGVLTDGGMYYLDSGDELKRFHVLDGVGFQLLREAGIKTAIITTSSNPLIQKRADKLKVDDLILGTRDKLTALGNLCLKYDFSLSEAAYIGDDIYDIPAIQACGFGCVPGDALEYVQKEAKYITRREGGRGCFREVVDILINSNEKRSLSHQKGV